MGVSICPPLVKIAQARFQAYSAGGFAAGFDLAAQLNAKSTTAARGSSTSQVSLSRWIGARGLKRIARGMPISGQTGSANAEGDVAEPDSDQTDDPAHEHVVAVGVDRRHGNQ